MVSLDVKPNVSSSSSLDKTRQNAGNFEEILFFSKLRTKQKWTNNQFTSLLPVGGLEASGKKRAGDCCSLLKTQSYVQHKNKRTIKLLLFCQLEAWTPAVGRGHETDVLKFTTCTVIDWTFRSSSFLFSSAEGKQLAVWRSVTFHAECYLVSTPFPRCIPTRTLYLADNGT